MKCTILCATLAQTFGSLLFVLIVFVDVSTSMIQKPAKPYKKSSQFFSHGHGPGSTVIAQAAPSLRRQHHYCAGTTVTVPAAEAESQYARPASRTSES